MGKHFDIKPPCRQPRSSVGDVSDLINKIEVSGLFTSALNAKRYSDGSIELIIGERCLVSRPIVTTLSCMATEAATLGQWLPR